MIVRTPNRDRYVIVSKVPLEDTRLSWKARGLHAYLMSKPDSWEVRVGQLTDAGPDGRDAVMTGLRELADAGYIRRVKSRVSGGRFDGYQTYVYEEPTAVGKSVDGKADASEYKNLVISEERGKVQQSRPMPPDFDESEWEQRRAESSPDAVERARSLKAVLIPARPENPESGLLDRGLD